MFAHAFSTLDEIGKIFGTSGKNIASWLLAVGLRTTERKPSKQAFQEGYVKRAVDKRGYPHDIWHTEKIVKVLLDDGHQFPLDIPEIVAQRPRLVGPFTCQNHGRLYRIFNVDMRPVADVAGDNNAQTFLNLLNYVETVQ